MKLSDLECPPRYATKRTRRKSLGYRVIELAEAMGFELMPWQKYVLIVALEVEKDGRLAYREVRLTVPRQSGKTLLLFLLMTHRCLGFGDDQRVRFSMQNSLSARIKLFDDFLPILKRSVLADLVEDRKANGSESVTFPNGSLWRLQAGTATAGHGSTLDLGVIDEAFSMPDGRTEQAMKPAMVTKRMAQLWIVSTAGTSESEWFNEKTDSGRDIAEDGVTSGVAFFEWSAPDDTDPGDESAWLECMPALGHTIDLNVIRADYASTPVAEFKRAYLNIRLDKRESAPWRVIGQKDYLAAVTSDRILDESGVMFGLEVSPDRAVAAISAAGFTQQAATGDQTGVKGPLKVELVDHRNGTGWVIKRLIGMHRRNADSMGVVIDKGAPAATFITELEAAGVPVFEASGDDHARWSQQMADAFKHGTIKIADQQAMFNACSGASTRRFGDRWLWSRRDQTVDVTPLVSATLARGALLSGSVTAKLPVFAY